MARSYAVGIGMIGLVVCAGFVAVVTGTMRVSAPVAIPILVMVMGPMLAAAALIATCSVVGAPVEVMDEEDVWAFHQDHAGRFLVGYLPPLMTRNDPMLAGLLLTVLERLEPHFPGQARVIGVLKNNLAWKARVVPAG